MPDLIFTIKTHAELQGAEAAAKAMEVNIGKAKALGQEYSGLETRLADVRESIAQYKTAAQASDTATQAATQATDKLGKETEQASEKASLFAGQSNAVKKAVQELSREFPTAGVALRAFVNPIGAALTLAIGLFVTVKRNIDEMNAKMDAAEGVAARSFGNITESIREAVKETDAAKLAFERWMTALAKDPTAAKRSFDAILGMLHQQKDATLEIIEAQKSLALAQVTAAEALGKADPTKGITSEQAAGLRLGIENEFAGRKESVNQQSDAEEMRRRQADVSRLHFEKVIAERGIRPAEAAANNKDRAAQLLDIPKKIASAQTMLDDKGGYQEQLVEAKKKRDELETEFNAAMKAGKNADAVEILQSRNPDKIKGDLDGANQEVQRVQTTVDALARSQEQYRAKEKTLKEDDSNAKNDFEDKKRELAELAKAYREATIALDEFQTKSAIDRTKRGIVSGIQREQRVVETEAVTGPLGRPANRQPGLRAVPLGTPTQPDQPELRQPQSRAPLGKPLLADGTAFAGTGPAGGGGGAGALAAAPKEISRSNDNVIVLLNQIVGAIKDKDADIATLSQQVQQLSSRQNASRNK